MMNYSFTYIFIWSVLHLLVNGQQLKDIVKGHINEGIRLTKEQLGLTVWVKGQTGYSTTEKGENVTFVLSGRDLGTLDPYVKISFTSQNENGNVNIGNTESGTETSSPDWTQPFWLIWRKGTGQKWIFRVLDHAENDRFIGEANLIVDEFMELGENATQNISYDVNGTFGQLIVHRTKVLKFKLAASNLEHSDEFNGKSDPYVKVYFRHGENGKDTKFYTTSTINNVENARWDDLVEFPNYRPGTDQYLHFKVRDADSVTKDDHLGEVLVLADSIASMDKEQTIYLENSGHHSKLTIIKVE